MLKQHNQFRSDIERMVDLLIAIVALTLSVTLRREIVAWFPDVFPVFDFWPEAGWLYLLVIISWGLLLDFFGYYMHRGLNSLRHSVWILIKVNVTGIMLAFFLFYLLRISNVPRITILLMGLFDLMLMLLKDGLLWQYNTHWVQPSSILFVGAPKEFKETLSRFNRLAGSGADLIGYLRPKHGEHTSKEEACTLPCLGTSEDLLSVLHEHSVDYVVVSPGQQKFSEVQSVISQCETEGVELWLLADLFQTAIARPAVDEFQGLPMVTFTTTPSLSWALVAKRVIDLVGASALAVLTAPLMALIALWVRLDSPGPVFFVQQRCTRRGRLFSMIKFRTMVFDAEVQREQLSKQNEMSGPVFKINSDPRITKSGRWLRKYSLDELPQLWNVLCGHMSLVGPRPPIPEEVVKYENWQRRRLSMPAGITGLWQVSGRNQTGFDEWMRMDLEYIDTWSLWLDIKILLKTIGAVLKGTGC